MLIVEWAGLGKTDFFVTKMLEVVAVYCDDLF